LDERKKNKKIWKEKQRRKIELETDRQTEKGGGTDKQIKKEQ